MKLSSLITALLLLVSSIPSALAQPSFKDMTCTTMQQYSQDLTLLNCRVSFDDQTSFAVAEFNFPFHITDIEAAASPFSSALSLKYPEGTVSTADKTTVVATSLSFGNENTPATILNAPFDDLSFLVYTDNSMSSIKALDGSSMKVDYLAHNPAAPTQPLINSLNLTFSLELDHTLVLESFTQYQQPSIIQFLRLAAACYLQDPLTCARNLAQNL